MKKEYPPTRKFECPVCKHSDYRMSKREIGEESPASCTRCGGAMKVVGDKAPDWLSDLQKSVMDRFEIDDFIAAPNRVEFDVSSPDYKESFGELLKELRRKRYISAMRKTKDGRRLHVVKYPQPKPSRMWINLILFAATFLSTYLAGYYFLFESEGYALIFSIAIMLMLGTHELGHKISAWRNGVDSTAPYFIPAPSLLGTLGAVISIRSPPPSRDALVEMGVAGPLAGFAIALPLTIIGLMRSVPVAEGGIALPMVPVAFALFQGFGNIASSIALHPLAFAGWVTMLLTMFNLIPAGQLDGGHVARGVLSRQSHYFLTRILAFLLIMTGFFLPYLPFWIWGFLIFFLFRGYHSGALDDVSALSRRTKILALVSVAVFILCLPIPIA